MFSFLSNGEKLKTLKLNLKTGLNDGLSDTVRQANQRHFYAHEPFNPLPNTRLKPRGFSVIFGFMTKKPSPYTSFLRPTCIISLSRVLGI